MQRGSQPGDENERVELVLFGEALGPWARRWLAWIAGLLQGGDGTHPLRPRDRVVLGEHAAGIAGVILWPSGHLTPYGAPETAVDSANERSRFRVHLWELLPISSDELAEFRKDPAAQLAWIDTRNRARDIDDVRRRWSRFGPPKVAPS